MQKSHVKHLRCVTGGLAPPELSKKGTGTWLNRVARGVEAGPAVLNCCKNPSASRMSPFARIRMLCLYAVGTRSAKRCEA